MQNIQKDMKAFSEANSEKSFSKSNEQIEKLLDRAEGYEDSSMEILSKALQAKIAGIDSSSFAQTFQSMAVDVAVRYNKIATIWYELLFEYKQTTEKLAREMMLFTDEGMEGVKAVMEKAEEEMNQEESGK